MKRTTKSIILKTWTGIKSAGRHVWKYLKSKEGRQILIQMFFIAIKYILGL
ncbi:hypothetical protein NKT34_30050 [Paenibacillus polysaccharolyticus]|uniref:hypothetical protein n=1 Tax=Paenibacillus TaxID=44249 RepID=UPI0008AB69FC|nr:MULTISPECIES: hypothetical protein [Paenibacillus]MCP1137505.1 hypothetical protein [Paenibacillus polysaccharolyticus]SEP33167.1 hypothetical protein SAMN05518670_6579 [Paenibacillus sp. OK076]